MRSHSSQGSGLAKEAVSHRLHRRLHSLEQLWSSRRRTEGGHANVKDLDIFAKFLLQDARFKVSGRPPQVPALPRPPAVRLGRRPPPHDRLQFLPSSSRRYVFPIIPFFFIKDEPSAQFSRLGFSERSPGAARTARHPGTEGTRRSQGRGRGHGSSGSARRTRDGRSARISWCEGPSWRSGGARCTWGSWSARH